MGEVRGSTFFEGDGIDGLLRNSKVAICFAAGVGDAVESEVEVDDADRRVDDHTAGMDISVIVVKTPHLAHWGGCIGQGDGDVFEDIGIH